MLTNHNEQISLSRIAIWAKNCIVVHYNQLLIIVLTLRGEWDQQLPHSSKLQFCFITLVIESWFQWHCIFLNAFCRLKNKKKDLIVFCNLIDSKSLFKFWSISTSNKILFSLTFTWRNTNYLNLWDFQINHHLYNVIRLQTRVLDRLILVILDILCGNIYGT